MIRVGSCDRLISNFLRNCHIDFQSGYTSLYLHQQWNNFSLALHSCQHEPFVVVLILPILTAVRWNLKVVLIYISLLAKDFFVSWIFDDSLETQLCHVMFFLKLFWEKCFAEADTWEDILLKQTHERIFCWCRHAWGHVIFSWSGHLRGCMMFRKNMNISTQTVKGHSLMAMPCNASLFFSDLHFTERNAPKNFLWYSSWCCQLPVTQLIQQSLAVSARSCQNYWLVFGVCYWTQLLVSLKWRLETPWRTVSKQVHNTLFPINLLSPLSLVGRLEVTLKHLRTLKKEGKRKI
jgi:hypothetical protein